MRVRVIIPYFGRWPPLFGLYLASCRRNPWLDVLFLTDIAPPPRHPDNVRFVATTLEALRERFSCRLGFEVALLEPYKVCDFRPAFGVLFQEELESFDFWGHGDIDVLYGDIRGFLTDDFLDRFDVVSCREEWISGSFCLYRNLPEVNGLFRASEAYRKVFADPRSMAFDETSRRWRALIRKSVFEVDFPYDNMTLLVKRAERAGRIRAHFSTLAMEDIPSGTQVTWRDGRIHHGRQEYLYFHWVTEKRLKKLCYPQWKDVPDGLFITPHGFFTEQEFNSRAFRVAEQRRRAIYACRSAARLLSRLAQRIKAAVLRRAPANSRF